MAILRNIFGVVAGIVASQAIVAGGDWLSSVLYPINDDIDSLDPAQLAAWVDSVPLPAKLILVGTWALASMAGPWLALRVADRAWAGWVVAALFLAASIANQMMLPHPVWMVVCAVLLPVAGGWLAQRLHRKPWPGEPLLG